jgi:hypothetical protein
MGYSITLSLLLPHFFNINLTFSSHLQLRFLRDTLQLICPAKIKKELLLTPMLSTRFKYLTFLGFIITMPGMKIKELLSMLFFAPSSDIFPLR